MKLSEALKIISDKYVPGVSRFYSASKRDPWEKAHSDLEGQLLLHGIESKACTEAIKSFTKECLLLIEKYVVLHPGTKQPTLVDAFHIADPDRVKQLQSIEDSECIFCGGKENGYIAAISDESSAMVCTGCVPR